MLKNKEQSSTIHICDLAFRYESLKADLSDNDTLDSVATLNLLGLLAFRMDKLNVAIAHFESALEEDCENINALQNLACTFAKLNRPNLVELWTSKVQKILQRNEDPNSEGRCNCIIARSLAEHAYTHAYDISLTNYEEKKRKLENSIKIYERALTLGGSSITRPERTKWYFSMATIFVRFDTLMMWSEGSVKSRLPNYNRAMHLLKEVANSDRLYYKALAWAYLGILIERQSGFETTPMAIHDCGFTGTDPLDYYSKSIKLAEKQLVTLNRLAKIFLLMGKHELAIGTINMSLEIKETYGQSSPASHHIRARINTTMYMMGLNSCKNGSAALPERVLLEKAKDDLTIVMETSPCLRVYADMGQVWYYMGVDAFKESFIINETCINTALVYFSKALSCDMGDMLPELHFLRGKCLQVKGELSNALECFKRAIEVERKGSNNTQVFRFLMETLFHWYNQTGTAKQDSIISDVDAWIELALKKFDYDVLVKEFRSLTHSYTHEVLELCKTTVKAGKTTMAKFCFSSLSASLVNEHNLSRIL
ncbi:tetratricopeptide repeat protein 22-like isoform X2 [Clavelina lepadiformis]|uniref:Uncharacterized protein n=1 Tax=Clavelina lepadiformis TaxID=159417 RepID=A0ABP0F966_CLALP